MAKANAVAPVASATEPNLPTTESVDIESLMREAGTGFENVTADNLIIPRLTIVQGLSPQVNRSKPEYDESARVGMIYDVGLQQGFPGAIHFIPVHFVTQWLEWAPRSSGGGLVNIHDSAEILKSCVDSKDLRTVLPNGNIITETAQFYGLNVTAGFRKSFLPFASTQLKKGRRLLTLATTEKLTRKDGTEFTPALYYRCYKLTTVPESNNKGDWMGWKVERDISLPEIPNAVDLMKEIKSFREALTTGKLKGDVESMAQEATQPHNEEGAM